MLSYFQIHGNLETHSQWTTTLYIFVAIIVVWNGYCDIWQEFHVDLNIGNVSIDINILNPAV